LVVEATAGAKVILAAGEITIIAQFVLIVDRVVVTATASIGGVAELTCTVITIVLIFVSIGGLDFFPAHAIAYTFGFAVDASTGLEVIEVDARRATVAPGATATGIVPAGVPTAVVEVVFVGATIFEDGVVGGALERADIDGCGAPDTTVRRVRFVVARPPTVPYPPLTLPPHVSFVYSLLLVFSNTHINQL